MQFQVPQFETENKIIGPFSFVQFIYVGVTVLVCFLLFPILKIWLWIIVSGILAGSVLAFALVKVNGRPMQVFAVAVFNYFWQAKILVYQAPVTIPVGLRNIKPTLTPGKKLDVPAKPIVPEEIIAIPTPAVTIERPVTPVSAEKPVYAPAPATPITPPATPAAPMPAPAPVPPVIERPAPTPAPAFTVPITPETPAVKAPLVPTKRPESLLQGLFNRITVSSSPIPQRELSLKKESVGQRYAVIQKSSGETEVVRRVDYR